MIDSNYFMDSLQKKDFQWLGTLTHELTHLLDFIQYAKLNNLDSYDVIQRGIIELVYIVLQSVVKPGITGFFKIDLHIKCYIYLS